jgi:protein-disulfide isomerase
LSCSRFNVIDFNDAWVADYMKENDIKYLPSIIFPTKEIDISKDSLDWNGAKITDYLQELKWWEYELPIWATYDPFVERSEKWFKLLIREQYDKIQSLWNYVDGNKDAKITWLEFSDLQCPYCAQIYSAWTPTTLKEKYGDKLNIKFNSFPLSFHPVAKPASEFAECLAEQKWDEAFYNFIEKTFAENNKLNISSPFSDTERQILLDIALGLWADEDSLTACVNENRYDSKIDNQAFIWEELFGITWTPWNVIINNETLEYEQIQWLASASSFEQIIDKMLE